MFRVFKPAVQIDVTITPPEGGDPIKLLLDLSEEQTQLFHGFATEEEKEEFVKSLIVKQRDESAPKGGTVCPVGNSQKRIKYLTWQYQIVRRASR